MEQKYMNLISKKTTISATWLAACEYLATCCPKWTDTTVVLHIEKPTVVYREDKEVAQILNDFLIEHEAFGNHTVAETIFPGAEYRRHAVDGVYNVYPDKIYPTLQQHPEARPWGTYAHRLLRRQDKDGTIYNPLQECIKKMLDKKAKRAAYELGFDYGFDLATYDDTSDRRLRMQAPCLSHLSFKVMANKELHLTALYRSHYYVQRLYGNLLGLVRLQQFVADQTNLHVGSLVCHSTMARLEASEKGAHWTKKDVKTLLKKCRAIYDTSLQCKLITV